MSEGLETFKQSLEEFARKHKKEINENPVFRRDFHKMCLDIGVDPLACTRVRRRGDGRLDLILLPLVCVGRWTRIRGD